MVVPPSSAAGGYRPGLHDVAPVGATASHGQTAAPTAADPPAPTSLLGPFSGPVGQPDPLVGQLVPSIGQSVGSIGPPLVGPQTAPAAVAVGLLPVSVGQLPISVGPPPPLVGQPHASPVGPLAAKSIGPSVDSVGPSPTPIGQPHASSVGPLATKSVGPLSISVGPLPALVGPSAAASIGLVPPASVGQPGASVGLLPLPVGPPVGQPHLPVGPFPVGQSSHPVGPFTAAVGQPGPSAPAVKPTTIEAAMDNHFPALPRQQRTQPRSSSETEVVRPVKSFIDALGFANSQVDVPVKPLSLYNGMPAVMFSKDEIARMAEPFKLSLVGKFSYGRPTMDVIRKFVSALQLRGEWQVSLLDKRHVLIKLKLEEDYSRIWTRQAWRIHGNTMRVFKWSPQFRCNEESPIVPVWVSLPYLPVHLMHCKSALFSIASAIGTPLRMDNATASISRPSVARVLVECDVSQPSFTTKVWVGDGDSGFVQDIIIEKIPQYCMACKHLGHQQDKCFIANPSLRPPIGIKQDNVVGKDLHKDMAVVENTDANVDVVTTAVVNVDDAKVVTEAITDVADDVDITVGSVDTVNVASDIIVAASQQHLFLDAASVSDSAAQTPATGYVDVVVIVSADDADVGIVTTTPSMDPVPLTMVAASASTNVSTAASASGQSPASRASDVRKLVVNRPSVYIPSNRKFCSGNARRRYSSMSEEEVSSFDYDSDYSTAKNYAAQLEADGFQQVQGRRKKGFSITAKNRRRY